VPEARSALPHYDAVLPALANDPRWHLLGHGHPRLWGRIARRWAELGVERVPEFADVLDRADVFVCDNSSALYEFASTGRPVVVLNTPIYRRDVEHGLRFWSEADVGVQVDHACDLADAIALALTDPPSVARRRSEIVRAVCPLADGRATQRAVEAICAVLNADRPAAITA
jgi:CDP-glycerol glycerophosphotransferase (TagB/SpsB family)